MSSATFDLQFMPEPEAELLTLAKDSSKKKRLKAVRKALGYLQQNPRYPSLNTHKFSSLKGPNGEEIFEAYAENNTPAAYRIFWCYGPNKNQLTVIAITPYP